jgi:NAD(P)-dependent dehydrogenase (short-subunit alcohol dehydrogenase family)
MLPEFNLSGKRFLLTGAGRGIGKGIALVLAEAGADVAVTGLTPTGINSVAEQVRGLGRDGRAYVCDATKADEMGTLAGRVLQEFGPLDGLVNCVGDSINKPVVQLPGDERPGLTEEDWHFVLDVNLTEAFVGCRAFGLHFLERHSGSVISISAWAAVRPAARRAAYDAAKAGLVQFTRSLALEWAPFGVRVNAIGPGGFPDPDQVTPDQLQRSAEAARRNVPLGRFGRLREVGLLAVYLLSEAGSFVTGQTWFIDGGASIA